MLQWGRGCSAAEAPSAFASAPVMSWLQWGRGYSAAEAPARCRRCAGARAFNGAADVQPRRRPPSQTTHSQGFGEASASVCLAGTGGGGGIATTLVWDRGSYGAPMAASAPGPPLQYLRARGQHSSDGKERSRLTR